MVIDNGPYVTKVNNILHVCNNTLYFFVLVIMVFLIARPSVRKYEEGEKERIAKRVIVAYTISIILIALL